MQTQQNYYNAPTRSTFVAYTCAALMIFFVVILCMLYQDTEKLRKKTVALGVRIGKLEKRNRKLARMEFRTPNNRAASALPPSRPATVTNPAPESTVAAVSATGQTARQSAAVQATAMKPKLSSATAEPIAKINTGDISTLRAPSYVSAPTAGETTDTTPETAPKSSAAKPVGKPSKPEASAKGKDITTTEPGNDTGPQINKGMTAQGKILATNQSQMRVILSLGSSSAIQVGNRFNVYRNDRWVGEIVVAKVFADMSMCEIKSSPLGIRVEDIAKAAAKSSR